jgi:hypothetical protein
VVKARLRSLYLGKSDPEPVVQKVEWAPEPVGMVAENLAPSGL